MLFCFGGVMDSGTKQKTEEFCLFRQNAGFCLVGICLVNRVEVINDFV
jgi:hypothetical protein